MDGVFFIYLASCMVGLTIVYAVMRWIDFIFTKKENKDQYGYNAKLINQFMKQGKNMMMSAMKEINNSILDMAQKWDER